MRNIENLIDNNERVWFYLKDQQAKECFVAEAISMGCRFMNGAPLSVESCSSIMSIHPDRKAAHVAIFVWNASFEGAQFDPFPLRVDYARYIVGKEDWECRDSHFYPVRR